MSNNREGFTLVELLVVIAIIGLLASIVLVSLNTARAKARDSRRISDLKQLQLAIEMYYDDYGQYPMPCRGWSVWSGHCPDYGNCDTNYIQGVVPTYISVLPIDPRWDTSYYGYLYNSNGTDYMIITHGSMETVKGGDPSAAGNPPHIQQMDRVCCWQPTIAVYSPGAKNW